jgi:hypothetical protein
MSLILQLTENREIRLEVDVQEWTRAFENALRSNEVVEVRNPDGGILGINPQQILYWKTDAEAEVGSEAETHASAVK